MRKFLLPAAALLLAFSASFADNHESTEVDPNATWDLTELFPTVEAWDAARQEVLAELPKIEARRGTLGDSAESLYEAYRHVSDTLRKGGRVFVYASLNADEDLREGGPQERRQLAQIMFSQFNEATAWMQPELIEVGREVVESFIEEDERLARIGQLIRRITAEAESRPFDGRRLDGEWLELRTHVRLVERAGFGHRSSSGDQDADAGVLECGADLLVEGGVGDDDVDLVEATGVGE